MRLTVIEAIAATLSAYQHCMLKKTNNTLLSWETRYRDRLEWIEKNVLPRGSGIDSGTKINLDKSNASKIVLDVPFHCMDENGYYCGWRDYTVTVKPTFNGISVKVTGRDYNGLKDYLGDLFHYNLRETMPNESSKVLP